MNLPLIETQSSAYDIRDGIYNRLAADSVLGGYTLRKNKMYPVPPDLIPYLGVYLIDEVMVPDGDANAGMIRFSHTARIGISLVLKNPDRDVLERAIDQGFWKIMQLLWTDTNLMNVLTSLSPEGVLVESITRGVRRHVWGAGGTQNETPFCELQYEISAFYRSEWWPVITDILDEIDVTTGIEPGDTSEEMSAREQVVAHYTDLNVLLSNQVLPSITPTTPPSVSAATVLTADIGTWSGNSVSYTYQWMHGDGSAAAGPATGPTYTVVAGDLDFTMIVIVVGSNVAGTLTKASAATSAVVA